MRSPIHARIETLAGAIALGEATDDERTEYRLHLSTCRECLDALGGECEIERTAAIVSAARDEEVWEPDVREAIHASVVPRVRAMQYGTGAIAAAAAIAFGIHSIPAAPARPAVNPVTQVHLVAPPAASTVTTATATAPPARPPERKLVVVHNVVQLSNAPVAPLPPEPRLHARPREIAAVIVHPDRPQLPPGSAALPASWHTVAQTTTTSLIETAPQTLAHHAEAIELGRNATREAMPLGGETALDPQPPMIAYDEGAQGTSVFEVQIDDRGLPQKCTITKSSGWAVLDATVCKAAMKARYSPKTIGGRPVAGIYQDAFTFRAATDPSVEGTPEQIH
jgi:protein TonB